MADTAGIPGLTPKKTSLEKHIENLAGFQKDTYYLLTSLIGAEGSETTLSGMFEGLQESLETLSDAFSSAAGGGSPEVLEGLPGTKPGLGGAISSGGFPSKAIKLAPKEKPTISDMLQLPVEFSMGFLLIYNKLDEMQKGKGAAPGGKKPGGIGNIFKGLLEGAAGIALLAVSLAIFAGAMTLFQFVQWEPALVGLVAFGVFVTGMVLLAKLLGDQLGQFRKFAEGIVLMTLSIILFSAAIYISALLYESGKLEKGLVTVGLFTAFVLGMTLIAKIVGNQLGSFMKFAIGTLILTAGILAFGLALTVTSELLDSGKLAKGMIGAGLFSLFILGMALIANFLSSQIASFILFAAAGVLFSVALLLFGAAIDVLAGMLPKIPAALVGIALLTGLVVGIGFLAIAILPALGGIAIFAAVAILLSAAFIIWSLAVATLALVSGLTDKALIAVKGTSAIFAEVGKVALKSILLMPLIAVFAVVVALLGAAFVVWSAALLALGSISEERIVKARAGIEASFEVLDGLKGMMNEIKNMKEFGKALAPFATSMNDFADVISKFGNIGTEQVEQAKIGIKRVLDFLINPASGGVASLFQTMDKEGTKMMKNFGKSLGPFATAMNDLGSALQSFGDIKPEAMSSAISILRELVPSLDSLDSQIKDAGKLKNLDTFSKTLGKVGEGLKAFADSTGESAAKSLPTITSALADLAKINLSGTLDPLASLAKQQKEVSKLADSIERISKSLIAAQKEGGNIFASFGSGFGDGGGKAGTATEKAGQVPTDTLLLNSSKNIEGYVKDILTFMKDQAELEANRETSQQQMAYLFGTPTPTPTRTSAYPSGRRSGALEM